MALKTRDLISIYDLSRKDVESIFETADKMDIKGTDICKRKILAALFFEPSTRTRLSFESAMYRLGGSVIGFADAGVSSAKKGESISDTARTVENYADIIVIRHSIEGSAKAAAESVNIPVINAGDGGHEHPTQTLLDLYTIKKELGKVDGIKVALCGDLKYGRTVHSLAYGLSLFGAEMVCVSSPLLCFPKDLKERLGIEMEEKEELSEALDSDVIYMTRVQRERFADPTEYERARHACILTKKLADKSKALIMHPLPRVDEIHYEVDSLDKAIYFKQAGYGIPIRMALISSLLGVV